VASVAGAGLAALTTGEEKDPTAAFIAGVSQVPVLTALASAAIPSLGEFYQESQNPLSGSIKAASFDRAFIPVGIAAQNWSLAQKSLSKASEAAAEGDYGASSAYAGHAFTKLATFTPTIFGNRLGQATLDLVGDGMLGEYDLTPEEITKQALGRTTPFFKDDVLPAR
jgi:hypothetical protein